jgi:hypothetical protein
MTSGTPLAGNERSFAVIVIDGAGREVLKVSMYMVVENGAGREA